MLGIYGTDTEDKDTIDTFVSVVDLSEYRYLYRASVKN